MKLVFQLAEKIGHHPNVNETADKVAKDGFTVL